MTELEPAPRIAFRDLPFHTTTSVCASVQRSLCSKQQIALEVGRRRSLSREAEKGESQTCATAREFLDRELVIDQDLRELPEKGTVGGLLEEGQKEQPG